jgi:ectoine hydroxylase-related dioxygenase (phytanoyl-CoA dioxygenase family)
VKVVPSNELAQTIEDNGFAVVSSCLDQQALRLLCAVFDGDKHAQRNLFRVPAVRDLAVAAPVKELVSSVLGSGCFAVRGIIFNKTPDSNWKVVWHQDRTIAVRERRDLAEFGPWTMKEGVPHVQPPARVMARMLAIRVHLDPSNKNNGPLRVIPGSHKEGRLSVEQIAAWREHPSVVCTVPRGGAILLRPLLLHSSSACARPEPRRVIHLEFSADELPSGLQWHDRV